MTQWLSFIDGHTEDGEHIAAIVRHSDYAPVVSHDGIVGLEDGWSWEGLGLHRPERDYIKQVWQDFIDAT
jgi:hypothetical protein